MSRKPSTHTPPTPPGPPKGSQRDPFYVAAIKGRQRGRPGDPARGSRAGLQRGG